MEPASLIGFAVVSIGLCWTGSLILGVPALLARPWVRRFGPCTERVVAASALTLAPLFSVAVTMLLIERSIATGSFGDHCLSHPHHPHLCLYHGAAWGAAAWAVGTVAAAAAMLATGLMRRLLDAWKTLNARRTLERIARPVRVGNAVALIAPATSLFCFVTGVRRPRIFVSSAAWEHLDDLERRTVIEHENAHVLQGDLWWRSLFGILATLGLPFVSRRLVEMWAQATERLCDARSARETGEPIVLAGALVKLSRCGRRIDSAFANSFLSVANVVDRVEALLRNEPDGMRVARWFGLLTACASAAAILLCARHADPLHHTLETLLALM